MNICLFTQEEFLKPIPKNDERAEHLLKILHKKEGDSFAAGIIGGKNGIATITKIAENIEYNFEPLGNGKILTPLKMIIGFPRPIQLKRLLRDIAALGICEVHLTGTELGEKSYMQSNLVEKGSAYKMLLDGSVQAGSTHIPELFLHKNLKECLEFCKKTSNDDILKIALDNKNPDCSLQKGLENFSNCDCKNFCNQGKSVFAAIGSERGWTDNERKILENYGFIRCGMGERIMRTETAATVAGAIILNHLGFLN